jgi:hypothetical protein
MFKEIKIGFLRGIGFALAAVLTTALVFGVIVLVKYRDQARQVYKEVNDYGVYSQFTSQTKLRAELIGYQELDGDVLVFGTVRNEGPYKWDSIRVEAELYDGDKFVRECRDTVSSIVQEGGSENFQITCGGCKKTIPKFDRVELKVTDAWSSK